jgi:hypothetical protein
MLGLAPAGIGAAYAVPAGASTYACATALGNQCGTFTESAYNAKLALAQQTSRTPPPPLPSGQLGWAVMGASSAVNTPLIVGPNTSPGTDPGTDLTKVEHYGTIPGSPGGPHAYGYWYSFVYTPSGQWTSMCVSNLNNPGPGGNNLVLRSCNRQMWQAFLALPISGGRYSKPLSGTLNPKPQLPPAPTWRAPTLSVPVPNPSSTSAYALYSMANGRFVEVADAHGMSVAAPSPGPGQGGPGPSPKGGALSATAHSGEPVTNTNTWFWTNANGRGAGYRG